MKKNTKTIQKEQWKESNINLSLNTYSLELALLLFGLENTPACSRS